MRWRRGVLIGVILLVVLGASGCRDITATPRQSRISAVDVAAAVGADGAVQVEQRVTFVDDDGGLLDVPVGAGLAELSEITVQGQPVTMAPGAMEVRVFGRVATIGFTVRRAVETWPDLTVLQLAVHSDASDASRQDPVVAFHGTITLPEAAAGGEVLPHWQSAVDRQVAVDGRVVTFDGDVLAWTGSEVTIGFAPGSVTLDADEALGLAHTSPHRADFETQQALRDQGTASLEKTLDDQARMADLVEPIFVGVAGLVILFSVVSTRRHQRDERRRRAALADDVPQELSEPPGSESPAVVNLLVAKGERVDRGAVAGTILALVERGVLVLHSITSEEFVLRMPADRSAVSGPDAVVLDALADAAAPSGELRGPPLWRASSRRFRAAYRRAVVAEARGAGLVERTLQPSLFLIYAMIFASCTWPLWLDQRLVLLAPVLGMAAAIASIPFLARLAITDEGVERRARWLAYRRWLRSQDQLCEVGAPGIVIWGPQLTYGAALGVAEATVAALSPDEGGGRVDARADVG